MASKRDSDFWTLPTVLEQANAACGMWELGCPEDSLHRVPAEQRAPMFEGRPEEPHDRERIASIQYVTRPA
jgi:hypothetical protein